MTRPAYPGLRARIKPRVLQSLAALGIGVAAVALMAQYGGNPIDLWWEAGSGIAMPQWVTFPDATGEVMVLNTAGTIPTTGHAFFDKLGTNGRACVTCHQPSDAMSLSTAEVRDRWKDTAGKDAVFAAIDGSNCPTLPQQERSSHSLLLNRGVFRIYQPWPTLSPAGAPIHPEFTVEVVRDPTGCNTDAAYGLTSGHPTISVFRRPRVVGNLKFVLGSDSAFNLDGRSLVPAHAALAADGRDSSLQQQAIEAARVHLQSAHALTPAQLQQILDFESQVFVAQNSDASGGQIAEVDGPLGAWNLGRAPLRTVSDDAPHASVFFDRSYWNPDRHTTPATPERAFRDSVARGNAIFANRAFSIDATANLTPGHSTGAATGTCATCHNAPSAGSNTAQRAMDVGTTVFASPADAPADLPLFKITCSKNAAPHPYLGRVLYTTDPGRALTTGKCSDVGSIVMQQFRGLSARAPYFSNGSAQTLRDVVDYYDRRFDIHLNARDKQDLVNFLSVL